MKSADSQPFHSAAVAAALNLANLIATKSPVAIVGAKQLLIHSRDHSVASNLEYTGVWNGTMINTVVRVEVTSLVIGYTCGRDYEGEGGPAVRAFAEAPEQTLRCDVPLPPSPSHCITTKCKAIQAPSFITQRFCD